jgi:hypothetical protein
VTHAALDDHLLAQAFRFLRLDPALGFKQHVGVLAQQKAIGVGVQFHDNRQLRSPPCGASCAGSLTATASRQSAIRRMSRRAEVAQPAPARSVARLKGCREAKKGNLLPACDKALADY